MASFAQPTKGQDLFIAHCSMCHGENADGTGPLASQLPLKPRNFRSESLHWGNSQRSVVDTVKNGRSGVMPSFKELLSAGQIDEVASYVWGVMPAASKKATTKPTPPATTSSRVFLVHQRNKTFLPAKLDARVGDTLVFVNDDTVEHEVHASTPGSPTIQSQNPRQWDRVVLATEGVMKFGCQIHPAMRLEVKVGAPVFEVVTVSQKGQQFSPSELTVKPGTRLTFVNDDTVAHNVTSREGNFDLEVQKPGAKATVPFMEVGNYEVRCTIHPNMKLRVHVQP